MLYYKISDVNSLENESAVDRYRRTTIYDHYENEVYMTEIQLKNIVERLSVYKVRKRILELMVMKPW